MPPPGACLNILEARHLRDGYGSLSNPDRFFGQDYHQLKKYCISKRVLYVDNKFPPDRSSIGQNVLTPSDLARVQWLRPSKIASEPSFVCDGISRFDFGQGEIKNCWFLASIGTLTFQKSIFSQVVPLEQNFNENYCGLFHLRFWRFGRWVDVVIDDKLPTINGKLIFIHSKNPNEFWPALMEKAYAKVCGSYTDMNAGLPSEAMMDFTGGIHLHVDLTSPLPNLLELMYRSAQSNTLMACGTPQGETPANIVSPNGLVQGHAYTVSGVTQIKSQGKIATLVRLLNPWGKGEWNGDWSDRSSLWHTVTSKDRDKYHSVINDGEFWMAIEDFNKFFDVLDICGLDPDFLNENSSCNWETSMQEGRWVAGTTAGGCLNNRDSFWINPQYRVKIVGKPPATDSEKNMVVTLMQKPDKRNRNLVQNLNIGIYIFEVTQEFVVWRGKFPASFFRSHAPVASTKRFPNLRNIMEVLTMKPGEYLIVPSTFKPNETSSFVMTIHAKADIHCYETSGDQIPQTLERPIQNRNEQEDEHTKVFFRQHSDKLMEVDTEKLQRLLNEKILGGDLKSGGFCIEACRSMVALMDSSITGKLNSEEFVYLWNKVIAYKDIFFLTDVSRTGTLSLRELRNAIVASGMMIKDDMLNLMALRYGTPSGHMTLESFISLIIRLECMQKIFQKLSDGKVMTLRESEWMYISMYA